MIRVLFVIDTLCTGGAERSLLELLRRFRSVDPIILTLYRGPHQLMHEFATAGIKVCGLELSKRYDFIRALRGVAAAVDQTQPQLLHATLFRSSLVARAVACASGIRLIDTLVNDSYGEARRALASPAHKLKLSVVRRADAFSAHRVDHFIANSAAVAAAGVSSLRLRPNRITVIPRGRDVSQFLRLSTLRRAEVRRAIGVAPDATLLLSVGRLVAQKAQLDILESLPRLTGRRWNVVLAIAGEGPLREQLVRRAEELSIRDRVHLLGNRQDVADLLGAADVFVFPSRFEGLPGALVEAALTGLPIVAADTPTNREVVREDCALLYPPSEPLALSDAISHMLSDVSMANRLGLNAARRARSLFNIDEVATRYETVLSEQAEVAAWEAGLSF